MVLLFEVLHRNAESVEKSCQFAYVLHRNADFVEKSLSETRISLPYMLGTR